MSEKKNMNAAKNEIIKSIVVLTVICLVISGIMAVVNHFTAPVSAQHAVDRANKAMQEIIPDADSFEEITADLPEGITSVYRGTKNGETMGYIFSSDGTGFGGTISVMVGIDTEGKIICCKTMDVSSETSTLGGKTANESYTDQYIGQESSLSGVEAISGATITSTAYRKCVEAAFEAYELIMEEY